MAFNNNSSSEAFESLKQYMVENHRAKLVSGGKEILKRCHICGDSRDQSDAHMYIGMKNGSIVYNCFKCNAGGVVDGKFLRDMDCYDPNIIFLCQEQNKNSSSSGQAYSGRLRHYNAKSLLIPISNNEYAQKKMQYIANRLGLFVDQAFIAKFKIILNLKDFLYFNGITKYTRDPGLVDLIDKFFIGFLSMDNRYVILRRLVPEGKLPQYIDYRYINYNIYGGNDGVKYYTIPTMINTMMPISIHIAEGTFDIISIFHNVQTSPNSIFTAVGGKTYLAVVKHFIMTYGFMNIDLHIYPDEDVSDYEMRKIKHELSVFNLRITIHRNRYPGEKDYGVTPDRIQDSVIII